MNNLFVQFYNSVDFDETTKQPTTYCENGLSSVWNVVNPIWVGSKLTNDQTKAFNEVDKIYVSVWSWREFKRVCKWAKLFNKEIVIGGPLIRFFSRYHIFKRSCVLPSNVSVIDERAERVYGNGGGWRIELPPVNTTCFYSYFVQGRCYWDKCSFCHYSEEDLDISVDTCLNDLGSAPTGTVWLESPSTSKEYLAILPQLDYSSKSYQLFIRGDDITYRTLVKVLPLIPKPSKLLFRIGVEFPSNRMLHRMNKGTTVEILCETINLLNDYGCHKMLLFICGWPDLSVGDMQEAGKFLDSLRDKEDHLTLHNLSRMLYFEDVPKEYDKFLRRYWRFERISPLDQQWVDLVRSRPGMVKNEYFEKAMREGNAFDQV